MAAECVKNNRNEFEKALGLDMAWLATEMSSPQVGMMTEEECENIKSPRLLTEAQKRGAIVNALVRTLELDIDGQNLVLFLQILEKKRQLYRKAISMLKGEPHNAADPFVVSLGESKVMEALPPPTSSSPATSKHDNTRQRNFSDEMSPDELRGYLCANQVPDSDCQLIRELNVGGAAFMHFDVDFWKKSQISEVGQFYIEHTKEKIKKSAHIQPPPSTASANGTHNGRHKQPSCSNGTSSIAGNHPAHTTPDRKLSEDKDFQWIMDKLGPHAYLWRRIGEGLGFTYSELSSIEAKPMSLHGAPKSFLSDMVSSWLKWSPEDEREGRNYATLHTLKGAVSKAGLGRVAEQL